MIFFNMLKKKISAKLISFILLGIILLAVILTAASTILIRSAFEQLYNEKLMTASHIILAQYDAEDFTPFAERLLTSENFAEAAGRYVEDRAYILRHEPDGAESSDEYKAAKTRMAEHRRHFASLKDEEYYSVYKRLLEIRVGTGVKYLYVITDLGAGDTYVYLFNAIFQGDTVNADNDDYGTVDVKSNFPNIERVYTTGEPVLEYGSYSDYQTDTLCYSYTPIHDGNGEVAAIIGVEINLQSLNSQLNNFISFSISLVVLITFAVTAAIVAFLRSVVINPIKELTDISSEIAVGNIYASVPRWITERSDEMGTLGSSYESMNNSVRNMYSNNNILFEAAMSGQLDIRVDSAQFKGFFAQLVEKMNDTLDIVGVYFDRIPGSLVILDDCYDIAYSNSHYKETFSGFDLVFLWQKMMDEADNHDLGALKAKLAETLHEGEYTTTASFTISGRARWFTYVCNKIDNNNGAVIVLWDNTELVLAKDKAMQANKAKSEFLSRVSHELRTPLNVIMSMAKLGINERDLENSANRFNKIYTSSGYLAQIINDVLDMSRMESGKTKIRYAAMDLGRVLGECTDMLSSKADEKDLKLLAYIDPSVPGRLVGDEFRIRQIIINLISNAIKFTDRGHVSVRVGLLCENEHTADISFEVSDTGVGMSEEFLEKIFTPFEQEDQFLSRRYEGTGLGLSISHDLVVLMGGEMEVASRLGEGSRFSFVIPFEKTSAAPAEAEPEPIETGGDAPTLAGKKILLVDDIEINRLIVREIFSETGAEITEAEDGRDAYEKFILSPAGHFDCVLMDIQMPKMDGYEATKAIRGSGRADSGVPVVAMTANALREDIDTALASGMDDHLAKPLDFDACIETVRRYANRSE